MTEAFDAPNSVYSKQDVTSIDSIWRRCVVIAIVFTAISIASVSFAFAARNRIATYIISGAACAAFIFFWNIKAVPIHRQRRKLIDIREGLSKTTRGRIVSFGEDIMIRDGLECFPVVVNVGEANNPKDDRLFYWNAALPKPNFVLGKPVQVVSHGNDIIGFSSEPN